MTPSRRLDSDPESIGALLVRVRLASGRSQLRVAELLCAASGVPTLTRHEVSRWEREERIPSQRWLRWLAVVLDVPLDELERATAVARARRGDGAGRGWTLRMFRSGSCCVPPVLGVLHIAGRSRRSQPTTSGGSPGGAAGARAG
ncbi:helix-turn-helix transcriptional regulator [Planosporangium flavigriseum]|uniref:HTH cro/C1-type domain-containing protein n=1 Tax=Planosporangium flavigriseum TaxID=373681 RepID=A0A8J3PM45_9ACTN|nr:helix-turn-helix transcriptional regulator [Planosporangium flavigriseum]NJC63247.1 helix-turn-helix transcriptional regulator [Planosporangium flavigriseum]GIG72521.1 hypothetical protein Pfl04_09250 [Planosporangium flavigriseum]